MKDTYIIYYLYLYLFTQYFKFLFNLFIELFLCNEPIGTFVITNGLQYKYDI